MAKRRMRLRKAFGPGDVPTELLASCRVAVDAQVLCPCYRRMAGEPGHTLRIDGWTDYEIHSIPKPH